MHVLDLSSGSAAAPRWSLVLTDAPPGLSEAVALRGREIAAAVPGCVHTDLMAAGHVADPYVGTSELAARWVGHCGWRYTGQFDVADDVLRRKRVDLVFDGIDTLATVRLNGTELATADNMHATWRFDVRETLRRGGNVLELDFFAPLPFSDAEMARYRREIGDFPYGGAGANPQLVHHMLRKMHCNFGWDWGPQLVTCGIWRGVRIEAWDAARIHAVRPQVVAADVQQATIEVLVDVEHAEAGGPELDLRVELAGPSQSTPTAASTGKLLWRRWSPEDAPTDSASSPMRLETWTATLAVNAPQLWWPAGHGEQPLYSLSATLAKSDGPLFHRVVRTVGVRTFDWVASDEPPTVVCGAEQPAGAAFYLRVNGRRVFCKGANWIPDDCFPHRVTPERYRRRVQQARDANMNMLRVWGGGIYEDDAFYDACDELGIMVWQDFATACTCYPEDEMFKRRFEREARDNVARLAGRASLALWCGGNESMVATWDWGPDYQKMRKVNYGWGRHYWYELFPRLVGELDPHTGYWPNSPSSDTEQQIHPNDESVGDQHIWDVWNGQGDWRNYWSHVPRFASEFGYHGPPTWPTLEQAIAPEQRHWFSAAMVLHNKQDAGQERAINRARDHFRLPERPESPEAFEAMWFVAALNQSRAIQAGCEWFRALSPWCGGALYWQLNDCWPVASWSAIDNDSAGLGRPKLLWYATRRFFAPRLCALLPDRVTPVGGEPAWPRVYLHNDHPERWSGRLRLRLLGFDGRTLEEVESPFGLAPGGTLRFIVPGDWQSAPDRLILAEAEGAARATWFFGRDKDLPYPPADVDLEAEPASGGTAVRVRARSLVRDLCLLAYRLDPAVRVSDQLLTLLPGETETLHLAGGRAFSADELAAPPILRCANAFGRP